MSKSKFGRVCLTTDCVQCGAKLIMQGPIVEMSAMASRNVSLTGRQKCPFCQTLLKFEYTKADLVCLDDL
jgi:hypothetical protein